jgi:hypothetical protein
MQIYPLRKSAQTELNGLCSAFLQTLAGRKPTPPRKALYQVSYNLLSRA